MRKEPEDLDFRTYSRVGLVRTYLEIAIDCYLELVSNRQEHKSNVEQGGEHYDGTFIYKEHELVLELSNKLTKGTIKVVIFISIFLESYINDLAGIVLGDRYSREHLDKLDFISKWIVIPRLITGKELDKSQAYFSQLKELTKWRNKLVHHKSRDVSILKQPWTKETAESLRPIYDQIDIDQLFIMVERLFKGLDIIDKPGHHLFTIESQLSRLKQHNKR